VRGLLFGSDPTQSKQWGRIAVLLLVGSLVYFAALNAITSYNWSVHLALWWEGYVILLGTLIVVQAYSTDSLLVSWSLAFAAVFGLMANYGGIGITGTPPGLVKILGLSVLGGLLGSVTIGTLGFAVGTTIRRITK